MAEAATKERGILMHARSVANILAGRKTQTRRIIKPTWYRCLDMTDADDVAKALAQCPYGQPGDRLYIRETWATLKEFDDLPPREVPQMADVWYAQDASTSGDRVVAGRTRSSLHMPRWASRITLEITDVRVDRVQDISEADALAEGVTRSENIRDYPFSVPGQPWSQAGSAKAAFCKLWDDTNGKGAWERNDWCWVVEFERVQS